MPDDRLSQAAFSPQQKEYSTARAAVGAGDDSMRSSAMTGDDIASNASWLADLARTPDATLGPDPGEVLGEDYVIERALGEGAMGVVYLARHVALQRKVAIKLHRLRSERAASRLLDEARTAARIQHENVLVVHGVGTWSGHVFVAMEFIDGPNARQWLAAAPRSWREIVALYLEAGRGLAAAHAQGVVHRDFKPDNILVPRVGDGRGRVKVADFGLARRADDEVSSTDLPSSREESRESKRAPMGLVGSPAYMAPEQYESADVDARADQFSYCVSLFESLFGRRPFAGVDIDALARTIAAGRFREPDGVDVPQHVRRVLRRGLAADPAARFPDMPSLLEALARDPAASRRRALGAVGAVAVGAAVTWGATRPADPLPECTQTPDVGQWWTEQRATQLREALVASGRGHAETTFARVDRTLASHRDAAAALLDEACRATHVDGARARTQLEAQRECLTQRGRELGALVDVLGRGSPEITDRAVEAVEGLTPVARCEDPDALEQVEDTSDPAVAAAGQRLAEVRSLRLAGRFDEASTLGRAALDDLRALGRPRVLAELLLVIATAEGSAHRIADASAALREASAAAVVAGADALAAEIAQEGVFIDGYLGRSEKSGDQWATLGWAWLERAQWPRDLLREQLGNVGLVHRTFDRHFDALVEITLALALSHGEGETAARASLLATLAETYRRLGRRDLARETATQAHDAYVAALGERHPYSINALNLVGALDFEQGKFDTAEVTLRRAIALGEEVLGKDSRRLIDPRANLATVLVNTGRIAEGVALRQQVYDIVSAPGEPRNETRVLVTANLATDIAMSGDLPRARALQREAMDMAREVAGPDSALHARQLTTVAELLLDVDPAQALANARQAEKVFDRVAPASLERAIAGTTAAVALALLERCDEAAEPLSTGFTALKEQVGEEHPGLSGVLAARGHCEAEAGRHDEAIALLDRAARLNDAVMSPNPMILEWQARALLVGGDRTRAREIYDRLIAALEPGEARRAGVVELAKALGVSR